MPAVTNYNDPHQLFAIYFGATQCQRPASDRPALDVFPALVFQGLYWPIKPSELLRKVDPEYAGNNECDPSA